MTVHGFNHYNLLAPRALLDTLRDFYCSVVGLVEGERPPFRSFGYWLYAGGRDVLHLSETRPGEIRATGVATTFDHVALTCSGFTETEAHLKQLGVTYRISEVPLTGQRQIFIHDPAGNGVELHFPLT